MPRLVTTLIAATVLASAASAQFQTITYTIPGTSRTWWTSWTETGTSRTWIITGPPVPVTDPAPTTTEPVPSLISDPPPPTTTEPIPSLISDPPPPSESTPEPTMKITWFTDPPTNAPSQTTTEPIPSLISDPPPLTTEPVPSWISDPPPPSESTPEPTFIITWFTDPPTNAPSQTPSEEPPTLTIIIPTDGPVPSQSTGEPFTVPPGEFTTTQSEAETTLPVVTSVVSDASSVAVETTTAAGTDQPPTGIPPVNAVQGTTIASAAAVIAATAGLFLGLF